MPRPMRRVAAGQVHLFGIGGKTTPAVSERPGEESPRGVSPPAFDKQPDGEGVVEEPAQGRKAETVQR